jgi:hypothetical protein
LNSHNSENIGDGKVVFGLFDSPWTSLSMLNSKCHLKMPSSGQQCENLDLFPYMAITWLNLDQLVYPIEKLNREFRELPKKPNFTFLSQKLIELELYKTAQIMKSSIPRFHVE